MQENWNGVHSLKTVKATETIYSIYSLGHKWKEKGQHIQEVMDWTKANSEINNRNAWLIEALIISIR